MKNLKRILCDGYGVGPMHADSTTIIWAAERLAAARGVDQAKRELAEFNAWRRSVGCVMAHAPYGSILF